MVTRASWVWVGISTAALAACGGQSGKNEHTLPGAEMGGAGSSTPGGQAGVSAQGGAARGGATAGGAAQNGGSGASPSGAGNAPTSSSDLPEPPPGCQASSHYAVDASCNYGFSCSGVPLYSHCDAQANGSWSCECGLKGGPSALRELMLSGVDETTACGVMARACTRELPGGEPECERLSQDFQARECVIETGCGPKHELGSGASALELTRSSVRCTPGADGWASCSCDPQVLGTDPLKVSAPSLQAACEGMVDFCGRGLTGAEPLTCSDKAEPGEQGEIPSCGIRRTCELDQALGDGVSLRSHLERFGQCYEGGADIDGRMVCYCEGAELEVDLQIDAGLNESCGAIFDACLEKTELEPNGPVTCTLYEQELYDQECEGRLRCEQNMKLGPLDVTAQGSASLACAQRDPGGPWWCSCASKGIPKTFELGPTPSPTEACVAAAERCPEEVEIDFGPHAPLGIPPAPLPPHGT